MDVMWQEYGMEELEKGMQKLFPASRISVAELRNHNPCVRGSNP